MSRSPFIPIKDRRHRIAAIALIRALIRTGQKITLPKDLQHSGPVHPVVHTIKKRVSKNKTFTSLRLAYASMAAGYRFLTMLTKAQTKSTPEYQMVVNHLRQRAEEAAESKRIAEARSPLPPPQKRLRRNRKGPLLTKVSAPGEPSKYVSTVRPAPKSTFRGERKVPVLSGSSDGIPYLRIMKPQPRVMNKMLGQKKRVYLERMWAMKEIEDVREPVAREEDAWDRIVSQALNTSRLPDPGPSGGHFSSYERSEQLSKLWIKSRIAAQMQDFQARGDAMSQIVQDEKALAMIERSMPDWTEEQVKAVTEQIEAEYKERRSIERVQQPPSPKNPFITREWQDIVQKDEKKRRYRDQEASYERRSRRGPRRDRNEESGNLDISSSRDPFSSLSTHRK
ncbi:hypothetical protein B0T10DRAFT_562763 [Thelonectria olida]|uniref:Uncharacterized protein n=1 Tax=Thelonectria olida TaxID=1576542 RepID=A0A9P8W4E7_9HYPO|nr:hypothetical protein B0T10DRAFT_562763 [Thelonectria olida]